MPKLNLVIKHDLSIPEAKIRLDYLIIEIKNNYSWVSNIESYWDRNILIGKFKAYGFNIEGSIILDYDEVSVYCSLPFAAYFFQSRIEKETRSKLEEVLKPSIELYIPPS
jgi:hypothetical protein